MSRSGLAAENSASRLNRVGFALLRLTFGTAIRAWFRVRLVNRPTLDGAYVLAPNHTSMIDPIVIGAAHPRRVTFMMTSVIYRNPWMRWFFRFARAISVDARGASADTLRAARAVLRRGEVLGIFPEGGLSRDGLPMLGNPGAVSLVLAEAVPVVPVWIEGAHRALRPGAMFPRPTSIELRFGEPISPDEFAGSGSGNRRARRAAATRRIMDAIAELGGVESREQWLERRRAEVAGTQK